MSFKYIERIYELLKTIETEECENIKKAIDMLDECVKNKSTIYTFGASHAGILSEELYYRAGGLMLFNPIFGRELMLDSSPITLTSKMERCTGYGKMLAKSRADFQSGDVLIVHSVSGRNPVAIEIAAEAKEKKSHVIAVTNLSYSKSVTSRHPSGKRVFELADIILDNHGDIGDACVKISGLEQKVSPTSTVIGAAMLNTIVAELAQKMVDSGIENPPIFYSANLDGGDELNQRMYQEYREVIRYKF